MLESVAIATALNPVCKYSARLLIQQNLYECESAVLPQDIIEEDEDTSGGGSILPPQNLELERQFVDGGKYSVVAKWDLPDPLPPGATGFVVYVNGEFKARVEGARQTNVLLSEIPRHQVCAGGG